MRRLPQADLIYLELETVLDKHRRAGVPEADLLAIIQRVWCSSRDHLQSAAWRAEPRRVAG
jgi:hypothetical protein